VTQHSSVPLDQVLHTGRFDLEAMQAAPGWLQELNRFEAAEAAAAATHVHNHSHSHSSEPHHHHHHHHRVSEAEAFGITSFVYHAVRPFHPARLLSNALSGSWPGVLRSKGFFWLATRHDIMGLWQSAGGGWVGEPRCVHANQLQPVHPRSRRAHNVVECAEKGRASGALHHQHTAHLLPTNWLCRTAPHPTPPHNTTLCCAACSALWEAARGDAAAEAAAAERGALWHAVWGDRSQDIVWIGVDMDEASLRAMLDVCLLTDEEMELGPAGWADFEDPLPPWDLEALEDEEEEEWEEGEEEMEE
jgi:G3E family GTPase